MSGQTMTPQDFIAKWRDVELKERTASQSHFIDVCHLLGTEDPITADPKGEWFTFEKGASKTSGGEGWADVWRKDSFAWEYKGKRANLDKAFDQLLQYAIALENPPLLIVSDMNIIRIHTNWTNTVQNVHTIHLDDMTDAANRDLLRNAFVDPEKLKPVKTRQLVTEQAAQNFANMAQRLRERGHPPQEVAHFINRLVFCMFAEDVDLLPNKMFERMIKTARPSPETFAVHAKALFGAMKTGGLVGFETVEWFNGGLFDSDDVLPLEWDDIDDLIRAAVLDWSDIDPSILGTLFERGLDPAKRSQLGAHYTDRDKIMQIVNPVIVKPLLAEWAEVKTQIEAQIDKAPETTKQKLLSTKEKAARTRALDKAEKLHLAFIERLKAFRALDPACGSGNFLYIALLELKNIEHRVNLEAEALGLPRGFPQLGPEVVLGIELSSYAAELTRVSVWIGEIQWMRRNGFEAAKNPILRTLNTIENRDAVLALDGTQAHWPDSDVIIGNPPYVGDRKLIKELGKEYTENLRQAYKEQLPKSANLVCYWYEKVAQKFDGGRLERAGLVTTSTIRNPNSRFILERLAKVSELFSAWSNMIWIEGHGKGKEQAALRVAITCFEANNLFKGDVCLDGKAVPKIHSDLSFRPDNLTTVSTMEENSGVAFQGIIPWGKGFVISGDEARSALECPINVNGRYNSEVLSPYRNATDLTKRSRDVWLIDFGRRDQGPSSEFEKPFDLIEATVKEQRKKTGNEQAFQTWWQLWNPRPAFRQEVANLPRYIATPRVSEHRFFVWLNSNESPDSRLVAIARADDTFFGLLEANIHRTWALAKVAMHGVGDSPTYNTKEIFETFPFPEGLTPNIPAADYAADPRAIKIAAAARLNELRENWLNPADLVTRVPEVVEGYPDRILPKDDAAAKELKKRTLTNLYNARPAWLDHAHKALDEAVAEAYGWGDDWRDGKLTDDEILSRLFKLNQDRAAAEAKAAAKKPGKAKAKKPKISTTK